MARPATNVTLLGQAEVISTYEDLRSVRLVDEAGIDAARSSLEANHDLVVQVHQFQRRLLNLPRTSSGARET